jgi:HPt (histidine-containing phosphotransfer) domain-containing protein
MEELARMLNRWLPGRSAAAPSHPAWDPLALGRLVGDNPEMQTRLLTKFLVNADHQMQAMLSAGSQSDLQALANVAHTLKSAARTVGAMALGEHCQATETTARAGDLASCLALAQTLPEVVAQATLAINQHLSP